MVSEDLAARMLAETAGERRLTDLHHVAPAAAPRRRAPSGSASTALRGWLRRADRRCRRARTPRTSARAGSSPTPRPCRCSPSTAARGSSSRSSTARSCGSRATSRASPSRCSSTIPPPGSGARSTSGWTGGPGSHVRRHRDEQRGEDLRLAYVALTRAKHQAVIWWAASYDSRHSPLGRLLFAKGPTGTSRPRDGPRPVTRPPTRALPSSPRRLRAPSASSDRRSAPPTTWSPPARAAGRPGGGAVRPASRPAVAADVLQRHHLRRARAAIVASEPEQPVVDDEPAAPTPVAVESTGLGARVAARDGCRSGSPSGRSSTRARGDRLRGRRPRRRARRRAHGRAVAWSAASSATRPRSSAGCGPRSRRRSARSSTGCACATSRARPARRARLRAAAGRRRRADRTAHARSHRPGARAPCRRRPAGRLRRAARGPGAAPQVRGYLTGSIDLVVRDRRAALRDRRLQDELARRRPTSR